MGYNADNKYEIAVDESDKSGITKSRAISGALILIVRKHKSTLILIMNLFAI